MRRRLAFVASAVFAASFAAMLSAQIALMSVLDTGRASAVAAEVADSAFVTGLIDDAVRNAVTPLTGPELAAEVAAASSADRRVRGVVTDALVAAHRQVVDPSAPAGTTGADVDAVVASVVDDLSELVGVDLSPVAPQVTIPDARPERVPDIGLRSVAEISRAIAATLAVLAAVICIAVHPRPLRGVSSVGGRIAWVCGVWAVGLLVVGWLIGRVADTLFGELLDAIWSSAAPAVIALVAGGLLLGVGVWIGGRALDGLIDAGRSGPPPPRRSPGRPPGRPPGGPPGVAPPGVAPPGPSSPPTWTGQTRL